LSQLPQMRLLSGTLASARTSFSGSVEGKSGTETNPAPSFCLRLLRAELELVRRVPEVLRPVTLEARPEPVRLEPVGLVERTPLGALVLL
jgi:hypothetical protein